jgi:UDP-N-acetyl-D-mannosaminuronate dehydrogenase
MDINSGMPRYVVSRIQAILNREGKPLNGSKVLLLGITYKPDIADLRESPSLEIFEILIEDGADARFFDPHVATVRIAGDVREREADLQQAILESDVVVLLQAHSAFNLDEIVASSKTVFDTRGVLSGANVERL